MVRPDGFWAVPTRAIAVEQTYNRGGGGVIPLATLRQLRQIADEAGIGLHCDGARIWHAHVADGVPLTSYGELFDTLSVCLSKGLGAPAGSLVVGSAEKIERARLIRKRMGGGMRQAGVLAAAGRYALAEHIDRLADDHVRAARLAEALAPFGVLARPGPDQHRPAGPDQVRPGRARASVPRRGPRGCWSRCSVRGSPGWSPTSTWTTPGWIARSRCSPGSSAADRVGAAPLGAEPSAQGRSRLSVAMSSACPR